jgi:hypothetical protein
VGKKLEEVGGERCEEGVWKGGKEEVDMWVRLRVVGIDFGI